MGDAKLSGKWSRSARHKQRSQSYVYRSASASTGGAWILKNPDTTFSTRPCKDISVCDGAAGQPRGQRSRFNNAHLRLVVYRSVGVVQSNELLERRTEASNRQQNYRRVRNISGRLVQRAASYIYGLKFRYLVLNFNYPTISGASVLSTTTRIHYSNRRTRGL